MRNLIIYIGYFYIFLGSIFLLVPLIYLEIGRPKDLIKASLNLLIGITLIIKNKVFDNASIAIYLLLTILIVLYVLETFSSRWNQLTDKEKNKLTTLIELKKNFLKLSEAINLGVSNFNNHLNIFKYDNNNENISKKKWVRKDKNDNIKI